MEIFFDISGARVKGLSFHPQHPWLLTSYYTGEIVLYDYIHKTTIEKFTGHDGPVRSVDFHSSQPLFVSCGDDKTIRVWNYSTKKCQFTLSGHKDYVRTVQFHKELPWIISCGDDMTIRIWNWINRTLLSTASGHDHYVMSAFFHPNQDWIVSASLDSTIRIWDYSVLRKKFFEARSNQFEMIALDVTMIHKLEGHERGVNWAVFHPNYNLICSASDDKTIRIWKYGNSTWNEVDALRQHSNNVSCCVFHPKLDYVISDSEDKTLRLWDLDKKSVVSKITKENERFWVIASHPNISLFAAGSDGGLIVFKCEETRIPSACFPGCIIYFQNYSIKLWKNGTVDKKNICDLNYRGKGIRHGVISIIKNPFINDISQIINFALVTKVNDKNAIVHCLIKVDKNNNKYDLNEYNFNDGNSACFLAKNRLCILKSGGILQSVDPTNPTNVFPIDMGTIDKEQFDSIYQGPLGKFFLKFKNGIVSLFDVNTRKIVSETTEITDLKYVIWNNNMTYAALVGQTNIFIINKNMEILSKIKEKSEIKSTVFDENNVLFYTTFFHVKYALIESGLYGIIKSTEKPIYLMQVNNSTLYYNISNGNIESENINYYDVAFKLNLLNKNYDNIVKILQSGTVYGLKTVENIQKSGFPDLSLKFVSDPKQKFNLALKSGKLEEAKEAVEELKDKIYYDKLAEKAILMGKMDIAEFCYVKSQNLDKLIFYYTLTGRQDKLKKVLAALKQTGDNSRRFLNAIYTNNVDEKIDILKETGHTNLAILLSKIHDKEEKEVEIMEEAEKNNKKILINNNDLNEIKGNMKILIPLKPVVNVKNKEYYSNWSTITELKKQNQQATIDNILNQKEEEEENNIFNQISNQTEEEEKKEKKENKKIADKWKDEDEEENDEEIQKMLEEAKKKEKLASATLTQKDDDILYRISSKSILPGVQVSIGNFKLALNYLRSQIGITKNYENLKNVMKDIYMSSYTQFKVVPYLTPIEYHLRNPNSITNNKLIPQNGVTLNKLKKMLDNGYDTISNFEMAEGLKIFRDILKYTIFFIATNEDEEKKIKEIISICSEYIYLTKISLLSDNVKDENKVKYCELICLMSICKLESSEHKFLIYKKAKYCCKNIKNFITGLYFIKKMLSFENELGNVFGKEFSKIKQEIDVFQQIGTNQNQINFDTNENLPNIRGFYTAKDFKRIGTTEKVLTCPLCGSVESMEEKGNICETCNLCTLGEEVIGFKLMDK